MINTIVENPTVFFHKGKKKMVSRTETCKIPD